MKYYRLFCLIFAIWFNDYIFSQDIFENNPILGNESINPVGVYRMPPGKIFSAEKFAVGIKGGINFSLVIPFERSTIFSGNATNGYDKDYNPFYQNVGFHMGFIVQYDISRILKISIQPSSIDFTYKYATNYSWQGNTNLVYDSEFAHKIRFFEVPLILGFHMTYKPWQPYFQGGIFYSRLINANTLISVQETSTNLTGSEQSLSYTTTANSTDLFNNNHYGIIAGAGIAYVVGNTRIGLEANYRIFLSNLNTVETQFNNNQIVSGNYDVPDKFKLSNLAFTLNVIVPLVCKNAGSSKGRAVFCE